MLDLTAFYHNFLKTHYSIKTFNYYSTKLIPVRHKKKFVTEELVQKLLMATLVLILW